LIVRKSLTLVQEVEDLALTHNVSSLPHFVFFKAGVKVGEYVGSSEEAITKQITQLLLATPRPSEHRALHWVQKVAKCLVFTTQPHIFYLQIGNLQHSLRFFELVLGLRVLRHEEFESGCEATCNGPYAGAWSKTMLAYGPERERFALELTYNYGIDTYEHGNDLQYIAVSCAWALERAKAFGYPVDDVRGIIEGPDGYRYKIVPSIAGRAEQFVAVGLRVSNLERAVGAFLVA
jgi:hypothetical protein